MRGVLEHRFPSPFPRALLDPVGDWKVDAIAPLIPWRASLTRDEAVIFARLGILRARDDARSAMAKIRARRERAAIAQQVSRSHTDPVAAILIEPDSPLAALGFEIAAELGVAPDPRESPSNFVARVRAAGKQDAGRAAAADVRAFIVSLAVWWWRQTHRRPQARGSSIPARADRSKRARITFPTFVSTAARDCGCTVEIARAVRTAIEELTSPPWC